MYVHPGDVNWWLFYLNQDDDPFGHLTLWGLKEPVMRHSQLMLPGELGPGTKLQPNCLAEVKQR